MCLAKLPLNFLRNLTELLPQRRRCATAIRIRESRKKPFVVYWINPATKKKESKSVETKAEAEKLNAFVKYQLKYERGAFKPVEPEPEPESQTTFESIMFLYLQARNLPLESLSRIIYAVKPVLKIW